MSNKEKSYMTTAQAAQKLGLSVGTIQKLVMRGELEAILTHGGHRRIFISSFEQYRKAHGYRASPAKRKICILHSGQDLDPLLVQNHEAEGIQLMSHPLDLLGMGNDIGVLFIDGRNTWMQTAPVALLESLEKNYSVFIYNSQGLQEPSHFYHSQGIHLIRENITTHFITGYCMGLTMASKSATKH